MKEWLTSGNRKVHQRAMNKLMRDTNENIASDELWRGRFIVRQLASQWDGHELYTVVELIDRLTGQRACHFNSVNSWLFMNGWRMFEVMNYFITEETEVWGKDPRPGTASYREMTDFYVKKGWPY